MQLLSSSKDFQLNKETFVNLRWITLFGQLSAVIIVKFFFNFEYNQYIYCLAIIGLGAISNIFLKFNNKDSQLVNFQSTIYLAYDIMQSGTLLYLTGGITNPFVFLIIIPSVFCSKYLNLSSSIFLGTLTLFILLLLSFHYLELPHPKFQHFYVPKYYFLGILISVVIGLIFMIYFGIKFGDEYRARKNALENIQIEMAKEHELVSLGGQAAAAAHSLGTPLSTISLIAKELKDELGSNPKYSDDINLLISQSNRSNEILKSLTLNPHVEDEFLENELSLKDYLIEIIRTFEEISNKSFLLSEEEYKNFIKFNRSLEINYGLRNFIGNANKFAKHEIEVILKSNKDLSEVLIIDDGPGFPDDLIDKIGQPYIRSSSRKDKAGLGLGTFIGKTLLEKNYAKIEFKNINKNKSASVKISWLNEDLKKI